MHNLIVSVEAYPDLKSNQNFLELQNQLTETEDRIAAGRRFYNANVRVYNTKVESVPSNIIANMFHFEKATYFEVNDPTVRQAPNVSFGEIAYRGDPPQGQFRSSSRRRRCSSASRATTCPIRSSTSSRSTSRSTSPRSTSSRRRVATSHPSISSHRREATAPPTPAASPRLSRVATRRHRPEVDES